MPYPPHIEEGSRYMHANNIKLVAHSALSKATCTCTCTICIDRWSQHATSDSMVQQYDIIATWFSVALIVIVRKQLNKFIMPPRPYNSSVFLCYGLANRYTACVTDILVGLLVRTWSHFEQFVYQRMLPSL